jgi:hypothetical protein
MAAVNTLSVVLWLRVPPASSSSSMLARVACYGEARGRRWGRKTRPCLGCISACSSTSKSRLSSAPSPRQQQPRRETGKGRKKGAFRRCALWPLSVSLLLCVPSSRGPRVEPALPCGPKGSGAQWAGSVVRPATAPSQAKSREEERIVGASGSPRVERNQADVNERNLLHCLSSQFLFFFASTDRSSAGGTNKCGN